MLLFFYIQQGELPKAQGSSILILLVEQHLLDYVLLSDSCFCIFNTLSSPMLWYNCPTGSYSLAFSKALWKRQYKIRLQKDSLAPFCHLLCRQEKWNGLVWAQPGHVPHAAWSESQLKLPCQKLTINSFSVKKIPVLYSRPKVLQPKPSVATGPHGCGFSFP